MVTFVWLFSTVYFQMCPQIACPRRGIVTLVAFVWLFSTVHFQMCPKIAWIRAGKVTLVVFVQLFSTVCFQMSPQIAGLRGCIITLVAFVWLFSTVWLIYSLPFLILVQTNAINVNIPLIIKEIYENAEWRNVKQMQPVWLCILWREQFEDTFEKTQGRKIE